jgi:quercetin dioxygenase-like cupin family protein
MGKQKARLPQQLDPAFFLLGNHADQPWQRLPWDGMFNKLLYFDPVTGMTMELTKLVKGTRVERHYHTTVQTMFLVSGLMRTAEGKLIRPGAFNVIPAGQVHGPAVAEEESVQLETFASVPVYVFADGSTYVFQRDGRFVAAKRLRFTSRSKPKNLIS